MAEAIVFGMAGNILSDLSSHAVQQIASAIGVQKDLNKLRSTLSTIDAVLKDADEQQLINNHELKDWVKKIKNACYEADDVLDEFATEALRRELRIRDNNYKKVWGFVYSIKSVLFCFKMSRKIKAITQSLDEIAADRNNFHLTKKPAVDTSTKNRSREHTHAFIEESEVFGRENDKKEIVKLLSNGDKQIIAIIGMGGMGKTTLAQLVYNDEIVNGVFDVKMWVGVYQDFNVKSILGKIIKSATNNECPDVEMDQLRSRLQELVKGKRFLLVLDDVWNEDAEKWDKLKFMVSSGASGSRVVITTRNVNVATIMVAEQYSLKELSSEDCWNVFRQRAFSMGEEQANPDLVAIGKQMADRCHGVALAAKTLGSLMCLKTTQREWEIVRDSDIWKQPQNENDIMPALKLSYNHLPSYLKECFAFFALSLRDYRKDDTIQSWVAYGFVRSSEGSQSLEDVGNDYVKELLWRSLIQEPVYDRCDNLISFKVHDLVCNLARDISENEYFHLEEGRNVNNPEEIRYAILRGCPDSGIKRSVRSMQNLRGFALECEFPDADLAYLFSKLKCLRSLNIKVTSGSFPNSIGKLKHLRRLILQSDDIQIVPESVTDLLNLQTLHLLGCRNLRELPKGMSKMIKLRHVYLAEDAPMSSMPSGFKYLSSLRTLSVFFVGKGLGSILNELRGLIHLEGQLMIKNLENSEEIDCVEVNLKEKQRLESLKFSWNDQVVGEVVSKERSVGVLEKLQPHPGLKILEIEGYGGSIFANWMMRKPLFPKLLEVSFVNCRSVMEVPPFGELPLLRELLLKNMDAVESIDDKCENKQREWFPSLKKLTLENLVNLQSFGLKENSGAVSSLPSLVKLTIIQCPRLEKLPKLPSVERVEVNGCGEKLVQSLLMLPDEKSSTSSLTRLKSLKIEECNDLISLPGNWSRVFVSLEELIIKDCSSLVSLDDERYAPESTCLTSLDIIKVPKLVHLPQWFRSLTKLQQLLIEGCEGLIEVPDWIWEPMTALENLAIFSCEKLKSLPDGMQSLTALEYLVIANCESMMRWPNGLGSLVSLKDLVIGCTSKLPSLPEELQQFTALRHLVIVNCQTMLALPEWLLNFTSLQIFGFIYCRNLQCLPDWFPNLTALQELDIFRCYELTSRCQKGRGADWPKIAHIPTIKLNGECIQKEA